MVERNRTTDVDKREQRTHYDSENDGIEWNIPPNWNLWISESVTFL